MSQLASVQWIESSSQGGSIGFLRLLDQTRLPLDEVWVDCHHPKEAWEAIQTLRVRGAPAIGIAAAYGVCIAPAGRLNIDEARKEYRAQADYLATSRPTAVNLFWALDRMKRVLERPFEDTVQLQLELLREAKAIHEEDRSMCHAIGRWGAELLRDGDGVLTHCNAGGLATAEYGTALSAIFTAQDQGKKLHVFADETRPLLQGSRLTAWELQRRQVPCTLLCDSMAAQVMREGRIQAVIVGADRITARGDTANKIGTYGVAILAAYHKVPFYVAAPTSTFDLTIVDGSSIPSNSAMPLKSRRALESERPRMASGFTTLPST